MNCDKELLVGYLYDELTPAERVSFDAHVATCDECRADVQELRATRAQLATWAPPEPDFGFRIIRGAAAPPQPRWRSMPAWGLAAAAVLVLAASAAIANLQIRYDQQGFSVSTGWSKAAGPQLATLGPTPTSAGGGPSDQMMELRARLEEVTKRLDAFDQNVPRADGPVNVSGRPYDPELLRRIASLVEQAVHASEKRQRDELALRVGQVMRDVDASRASDLDRVQRALNQNQGMTDAQLLQTRSQVEYLMRVSSQK